MTEMITMPTNEFLFVGEHPVLDFINTEIAVRGKPKELITTPTALGRWWQAAQAHYPELHPAAFPSPDQELLERGREFRALVRRVVTSWIREGRIEESDLQHLNMILSEAMPSLYQPEAQTMETRYVPRANALYIPFLPLAIATLTLLTTVERERLHECHNDRCVLLFLDTTRSKTRQWCSLACLERERSRRRHRERQLIIDNE